MFESILSVYRSSEISAFYVRFMHGCQKCLSQVRAILEGELSIGNSPCALSTDNFFNYILNWLLLGL